MITVRRAEGLLKPTMQITMFSVLVVAISFMTQAVVAYLFGATGQRDAYFAAIAVVTYVSGVFAGAFPMTFMPLFIEHQTQDSEQAWKIASGFVNSVFVLLLTITVLGLAFSQQIIAVAAPGFEGERFLLAVTLFKITLPSIIFANLTGLLSSLYYAEHEFLLPAISSVVSTIMMLVSVVLFSRWMGIKSLAIGFLIGSFVGCALLMPSLVKRKRYFLSFGVRNEAIKRAIKVALPLILLGSIYRIVGVFEKAIASTLPPGSISYLGYANQIALTLATIVSGGIATTIFPAMSRAWSENNLIQVRGYFAKGVRIILLTTAPIAALLIVFGVPVIRFVFERGAFDHQATVAVSHVLAILMGAFIFNSLGGVVAKGFYISQRTRLVAFLEIVSMAFYIVLAYVLGTRFSFTGLAIASTLGTGFSILIFGLAMRNIYKGINGRQLANDSMKILIAIAIPMLGMEITYRYFLAGLEPVLSVGISSLFGISLYVFLLIYIFRVDEGVSIKKRVLVSVYRFVSSGN